MKSSLLYNIVNGGGDEKKADVGKMEQINDYIRRQSVQRGNKRGDYS